MIFTGYTITHGTLTIMLYLGTLDGLTQDIPTNWILICIWLMFSYLIEVCGFWLEKKHTHTIHGKVGTVWLHCFCAKIFPIMGNYAINHMILFQFCQKTIRNSGFFGRTIIMY